MWILLRFSKLPLQNKWTGLGKGYRKGGQSVRKWAREANQIKRRNWNFTYLNTLLRIQERWWKTERLASVWHWQASCFISKARLWKRLMSVFFSSWKCSTTGAHFTFEAVPPFLPPLCCCFNLIRTETLCAKRCTAGGYKQTLLKANLLGTSMVYNHTHTGIAKKCRPDQMDAHVHSHRPSLVKLHQTGQNSH